MIKRKYVCLKCQRKFEVEVFEPGEAEKKRAAVGRVRCPECKDINVMDADKL